MNTLAPVLETRARDPHIANRRAVLAQHPEILRLVGHDRRPLVIAAVVTVVQLGIASALQRYGGHHSLRATGAIVLLAAYLLGAVLSHMNGSVIHEATHNLCARTTLANRWIGLFANVAIPLPLAMSFRRRHLDHHGHMGRVGLDRDVPTWFEVRWLARSRVGRVIWWLTQPLFGIFARGYVQGPDRWELLGVAVQMTVNAVVWLSLGRVAMAYLALSALFAIGPHPIAAHFVREHDLWSDTQQTYSYYGALNALMLNVGYHNEHHDFPGVPGLRLPTVRALARDHYDALVSHPTLASVVHAYLRDPPGGYDSRLVRDIEQASRRASTQIM